MVTIISILMLFHLTTHHLVMATIDTIAQGTHNISDYSKIVRFVSHPKFNRKSKYNNNKMSVWSLQLGERCSRFQIFCVFFETQGKKDCSRGDILTVKSGKRKMRYCGSKKPSKQQPLILSASAIITWRTDKTKTMRGFDCRVKCVESTGVEVTTEASGECKVIAGPGKGKPCVFPFTWSYTGVTYTGCAYHPSLHSSPWCSTRTVDGAHVVAQGEWGYCHPACPLSPGVTTLAPTTPPPTLAPGIAAGCRCGAPDKSSKIINGEETEVNEYRWMVGMTVLGSLAPLCGGSLISDQYVLTAAHCCKGKRPENIEIFLGDHNWAQHNETASFRRSVSKIKIHPKFGKPKKLNYDVCLIKLSKPISFPDHPTVRPVCLPQSSKKQYENYNATITGWGKVTGDGEMSAFLQETEVKILANKRCKRRYGLSVTPEMLCITRHGPPVSSACNGDSGGSLVVMQGDSWHSVGLVSWGVVGCAANKPAVMARITSVRAWIKRNTADSNYCPRI